MLRYGWIFVVFLLSLFGTLPEAHAQKRVALVVGIDRYYNLRPDAQLKKARGDASSIAQALRDIGFEVIVKHDLTRSAFNVQWQEFLNTLAPGDTAAFFFAGHGIELSGLNYLLPSDVPNVRPGRDELLRRESLSLQEFLADLRERGTRLNLVILDACRDNPFEQLPGRSIGGARGLAMNEPPEGTFIMFSAGTGESALDRLSDTDSDPNSIYTRLLLPLIKAPDLSLTDVAEQVRTDVRELAESVRHRQTPAYYSQVLGRVCLAGGDCNQQPIAAPTAAPVVLSEAAEAWDRIRESTNIALLDAFAQRFDGSFYADLARAKQEEVRRKADEERRAEEEKANARRKKEEQAKAQAKAAEAARVEAEKNAAQEAAARKAALRALDGKWSWVMCPSYKSGCTYNGCQTHEPDTITIKNGVFSLLQQSITLSQTGAFSFKTPNNTTYRGQLSGNSGSGTFSNPATARGLGCSGTFRIRRK